MKTKYDNWDLSKKNTYIFCVNVPYYYEVDADTEEEARYTLEEKGGIEIMGDIGEVTHKDYLNASLESIWEGVAQ